MTNFSTLLSRTNTCRTNGRIDMEYLLPHVEFIEFFQHIDLISCNSTWTDFFLQQQQHQQRQNENTNRKKCIKIKIIKNKLNPFFNAIIHKCSIVWMWTRFILILRVNFQSIIVVENNMPINNYNNHKKNNNKLCAQYLN